MIKRTAWVDNAKGLGILLVLIGHHKISPDLITWISSFHMPLFFFISGCLFNSSKYPTFGLFINKKVRTILVPYFSFAFVSYLFWLIVVRNFSINGSSLAHEPIKAFIGIFYAVGVEGWQSPMDIALWFLPCLFVTEILFYQLHINHKARMLIILIGMAIVGYLISVLRLPRLPWSIEVSLTASVFYGLGFLYKGGVEKWLNYKYYVIFIVPLLMINIWAGLTNHRIDMNSNCYGNPVLFYISSIAGILFLIGVSRLFGTNRLLNFLGRNTLFIMSFAGSSFFVVLGIIYLFKGALPPAVSETKLGVALLYSACQILIITPVMFFIKKFLPFLIGFHKQQL